MTESTNESLPGFATATVSSTAAFKKRLDGKVLKLPSGLFMRCRKVDLKVFITKGDVPNSLLPLIESAIAKGKGMDMDAILGTGDGGIDLDKVRDMYDMVDSVVVGIALDPKVHPEPKDGEDKSDDLVYTDEVGDEDKMFLFQWACGGVEDVATFRDEAEKDLVALVESKGLGGDPQ